MKIISVFSVNRLGKMAIFVVVIGIFSLLLSGAWNYIQDTYQVRADRSNAMQVTRPILSEQVVPVMAPDFFTEYRLERDKIRSERSDLLREIIKNAAAEDTKHQAQETILKMTLEKQREAEMENLIKAKGFTDALVFISDNSVSAVVKTTALTQEEVVQVAEVISRLAGVKPEDITVSAKP
ncbi:MULTISPECIES: SpoIIIAH-like family protein [Sporomusa]|jgi:stage III sporulation protein AH|uniref:SpoIIIAH-like protein n=1 Tax=Sporomusa sphaeroides DSM 2875 TaxID=1337886 RepID=A0ABP2C5G3_9FIRM|nr:MULTISPECIES: SpoIIIAH-like family protein [Sporomusa]MCM0757217.1 SpoIIIAH-like family protein [Sporomusa sphaeroides DSM 2875]OLS58500.1 SpoIIIAH-like protein [Sporomusa sphaeroides DSM 2875]CVK19640.1 SpoIIIAH-like protein [Sporomusa sphaeroides DSM 2875]HML34325.1 SpoIIIAH-like family protein [Sporomusa sphaeroides]